MSVNQSLLLFSNILCCGLHAVVCCDVLRYTVICTLLRCAVPYVCYEHACIQTVAKGIAGHLPHTLIVTAGLESSSSPLH